MEPEKLSCLIVDDEPLAGEILERYVRKTPLLEWAGTFHSAKEASAYMETHSVDLVFLDIKMPETDGLTFSQKLVDKTMVIFTTAYSEYAIDGYKVEAVDYLLKPINYSEFTTAVDKAFKRVRTSHTEEKQSILVTSKYRRIQIQLEDILCVKSQKDYVKIYLSTEDLPVKSLTTLKNVETLLPKNQFAKVHRSFIVNKEKILRIERGRIVLGKISVPISDSLKHTIYEQVKKVN